MESIDSLFDGREKHTPGPWAYSDNGHFFNVGVARDCSVVSIYPMVCIGVSRNQEANARLIAAAPDMLEALQLAKLGLEAMIEDENCGNSFIAVALTLDKINFAIAKAEGKS